MTIRDASGAAVPTDRCACGRHKEAAKPKCCSACGTGTHGIGCVLRQEHFGDTKRGVGVGVGASSFGLWSYVRVIRATEPKRDKALLWWDGLSLLDKSHVRQRQAKRGEGPYIYADAWWTSLSDARILEVHKAETHKPRSADVQR